eukprot:CAMPEP_0119034200 /NCGR_PEP_ID=MMETSP1177-20130426/1215_1 /TAXON_ID=2985 /ORGANISM="Ochromonas sp, Strain CCMP1899" /LENGTH=505 /DNA_ID=CAMNT_0006991479 /DNA_START=370 /DNA_END=1887 /DNA_ORIENTATION=+
MTKFMVNIDNSLIMREESDDGRKIKHVFLMRDPLDMIASWNAKVDVHHEQCSLIGTDFPDMLSLYCQLKSKQLNPIVIDSNLLKEHPREILSELCTQLDIPFYEEQLSWPVGPKPSIDGLWASYWYDKVHKSTGFATSSSKIDESTNENNDKKYPVFDAEQICVYRDALPFYESLRRYSIGFDSLNPGSSCSPKGSTLLLSQSLSHKRLSDPRNADILVWVGDRLLPREMAKVSVFDSAVQGGDAVWEGLRVYNSTIFKLEEHLQRLLDSAKALAFSNIPSLEFIRNSIFRTLAANGMRDSTHIRLTLTRGPKSTSSMNPSFNIFGTNLIVLPEWKPICGPTTYDNEKGISLVTASGRRNSPQCVDSKIHHCNLINNILPKIQANLANCADALMLDPEGYVSETNATNIFMIKHGIVYTPHADFCLPGITRGVVMEIIPVIEKRLSLAEFHTADEVFTTGSMGEITKVVCIDGRNIGDGSYKGEITSKIRIAFRELTDTIGVPFP